MGNFLLTLLVGLVFGHILLRLKIPGGMMVGSIISVSILNICSGRAYVPGMGRIAAQIIAGAFIAIGLNRSDLKRLRNIYKPAILLLTGLIILNIILGFIIYKISNLDLATSFMSAMPGGLSEIPIMSEEMGASFSIVAVMQFTRLIFGVTLFPSLINKISKSSYFKVDEKTTDIYKRAVKSNSAPANFLLTMVIATVFGLLGKKTGIPSAIILFSMVSIIIFNLTTNKGAMPRWTRWIAQLLSGAYIGSSIGIVEVRQIKYLIVPIIILVLGYLIACFLIGNIMRKRFNMSLAESMLAATPAGASDMALISADIGIESADVIVLQIIRKVSVVSIFPQIINIILMKFG